MEIPCKDCICLPACIQKYETHGNKFDVHNPSLLFRDREFFRCEKVLEAVPYTGKVDYKFKQFNKWWHDEEYKSM